MYRLEVSGIYIVEKDLGMAIDAYSTWTIDQRPFIVLGNLKKSAVRRNFDLAHELGHLLLHTQIDMTELSKQEYRIIEKQANTFASFFLLPEAQFCKDFSALTHRSNPDAYIDLKQKYLVSIAAIEVRAYNAKLMTYQENRYFYGLMNKKGYRTFEPLDDQIRPVKPGKIKSLFETILNHDVLNFTDFLSEFSITPDFLIRLFNLPTKFFDQFMTPQHHYFDHAQIISFKSKQLKEN
jgi:Zn-dependent peptidase ImmA (M78 family)